MSPYDLPTLTAAHLREHGSAVMIDPIGFEPPNDGPYFTGCFDDDGRKILASISKRDVYRNRGGYCSAYVAPRHPGEVFYLLGQWGVDREHDRSAVLSEAGDDGSVPFLFDGAGGFGGGVAHWWPEWQPAVTMPQGLARTRFTIVSCEPKQMRDITVRDWVRSGIQPSELSDLYEPEVIEALRSARGEDAKRLLRTAPTKPDYIPFKERVIAHWNAEYPSDPYSPDLWVWVTAIKVVA